MRSLVHVTRRTVLAQVSALGVAAVTGLTGLFRAVTPAGAAGSAAGHAWETAGAPQFGQMIGHTFRVRLDDGTFLALRLVEVEAVVSGPHRPAHLRRREGVVLVFDGARTQALVEQGSRCYQVRHARLGTCDLLLGPVPRRSGGHYIEAVLN